MQLAELHWIMRAQMSIDFDVKKRMLSLRPEQDSIGLWRTLGRVYRVNSAPYLIPHSHPLAGMVFKSFHEKYHCGAQATHAKVREIFWVTKGSQIARLVAKQCVRCRLLRKTITQVEMAPLKPERLSRSQIFEVTD